MTLERLFYETMSAYQSLKFSERSELYTMKGDTAKAITRGGLLHIFLVWGRAIGKGIDFHDFGMRNGVNFQDFGIRSGILFRKIGIRSGIHFRKIGIRNGYVFEAWMALPRPKSGQVHPRGAMISFQRLEICLYTLSYA